MYIIFNCVLFFLVLFIPCIPSSLYQSQWGWKLIIDRNPTTCSMGFWDANMVLFSGEAVNREIHVSPSLATLLLLYSFSFFQNYIEETRKNMMKEYFLYPEAGMAHPWLTFWITTVTFWITNQQRGQQQTQTSLILMAVVSRSSMNTKTLRHLKSYFHIVSAHFKLSLQHNLEYQ